MQPLSILSPLLTTPSLTSPGPETQASAASLGPQWRPWPGLYLLFSLRQPSSDGHPPVLSGCIVLQWLCSSDLFQWPCSRRCATAIVQQCPHNSGGGTPPVEQQPWSSSRATAAVLPWPSSRAALPQSSFRGHPLETFLHRLSSGGCLSSTFLFLTAILQQQSGAFLERPSSCILLLPPGDLPLLWGIPPCGHPRPRRCPLLPWAALGPIFFDPLLVDALSLVHLPAKCAASSTRDDTLPAIRVAGCIATGVHRDHVRRSVVDRCRLVRLGVR